MKPKKLKLAILTHEYYPILSGGSVFAEKLADALIRNQGYEIEILTNRLSHGHPGKIGNPHIKVTGFSSGRRSLHDASLFEHLLFFFLCLPQIWLYLRRSKPDLLFTIFAIPSGFMGCLLQKILGIPNVVFVDAADIPGAESAMQHIVKYIGRAVKTTTKRSAGVVICDGMQDLAQPYIDNNNAVVIPNGTTLPLSKASPNGDANHKVRILSIGRLVLRKGFMDTLEALSFLKEVRDDFVFNIIGYGTKEQEIKSVLSKFKLENQVRMVGRVEYEELIQYYLNSDLYIFYGGQEGSSLAMIEAVAYGLPVIATDHPGNRAYVENGKNGYLVPYQQPRKLADAIERLLDHRELLPVFGKASQDHASTFSWDAIAAKYDRFFRNTIDLNSQKT